MQGLAIQERKESIFTKGEQSLRVIRTVYQDQ